MNVVVRLGVAALLLGVAGAPSSALAAEPRRGPAPAWVEPLALDYAAVRAGEQGHDSFTLLWDSRVRVEGDRHHRYERRVRRALTAAGVERLAELMVGFDPEQEQLVLHRIELRRGSESFDQTKSARVRLVADESDLERRQYNGDVTAFIVLSDVRAGDAIDFSYSVVGSNPVLAGRYVGYFSLVGPEPMRQRRIEILPIGPRPELLVKWLGAAPKASSHRQEGNVRVELEDVAPRQDEDRVPGFERTSWLEATEYGSWQEVAAWGAALYPARPLHPAITEQAASLARESTNAEEVALRILRFVQDEVRYLAISNEGHALRPHPPEQVLAQRFGDCKDKVYLLQHLLRARGIDSWPMLVHSDERGRVVSHRPSPFAFDHVILRIAIAERKYHVDATHAQQGGTLATQVEPDFAAGLLLSPTATDLESIPARALGEPEQQSDARLKVAADGSAALEIATTFRGSEADDKRSEISGSSLQMLSEQYANYYGKQFPDLQVLEPLQVEDQRLQNRVLTRERYRVGAFWRNGERYLPAEAGEGFLSLPRVVRRVSPLALRHQVWLESRFTIALPFVSTMPSETEVIEDGFFKFSREIRNTGAEVVATFAYRSLADEVPAERVPEHVTALQRAQDHDGINVYEEDQPQGRATPRSDGADLLVVIGTLGGLMALLFAWPTARALAKAFRRRKFRRARLGDLGETPARAAPAGTFQSAEAALAKLRCACGQALDAVAVEWSSLRFQDATLHAARLQCSSCGDAQRRYFSIARAEPSPEPDKT